MGEIGDEAKVMMKVEKLIDSLPVDAQRRVARRFTRKYGGPMTTAERQAEYRERNALVTAESNGNITDTDEVALRGVCSSSSASVRSSNLLLRKDSTEVLAFLNKRTNRSFRFIDANLKLIECRLKEGATVQDCKSVIARQVREWLSDPKMTKYLRPETLFNKTKFESYRGLAEPSDGMS